jgi:hypothetical protein
MIKQKSDSKTPQPKRKDLIDRANAQKFDSQSNSTIYKDFMLDQKSLISKKRDYYNSRSKSKASLASKAGKNKEYDIYGNILIKSYIKDASLRRTSKMQKIWRFTQMI